MCGIFGVFSLGESADLMPTVERAVEKVRHRGPNDRGVICGDLEKASDRLTPCWWSLGHACLSILDLSASGRQPMCDRTKKVWMTFNGEIYNYLELRSELAQAGFLFTTETDSEVLLAAYLHWGKDCVRHFIGRW